jgi:GTP1/Obg family GTP-binding protein
VPYRVSSKIDNSNTLNLKLNEARIENSLIENLSMIEALLFQCKCVLFLIDITRKNSFEKVKDILNVIDFCKFHYLSGIIVFNKSDLINRENIEIEKIKILQKN